VTPFDAAALLTMLLAFYPVPSPANLVTARRERPEYFAGAALIGRSGDKIQLPDGRIFDLIFAVDGPIAGRRWQVIEPGPAGPVDPWALEEGPLTPIEWLNAAPSGTAGTFEALVGGAAESLGGSDGVLEAASNNVAASAESAALADGGAGELDDVDQAVAEISAARSAEALADVIGQSEGLTQAIDATDAEYDEAPVEPSMPEPSPYPPPPAPEYTEPTEGGPQPGG